MNNQLGTFLIKDRRFQVADATLQAFVVVNRGLLFYLDVKCKAKKFDGDLRTPMFYVEQLPVAARSFSELFSTPVAIESGKEFCSNRILPGCELCCLYGFEHTWLNDVKISFSPITTRWMSMDVTAQCDVFWDDDYGRDLPLTIQAPIEFLGVTLAAETESRARDLLRPHFSREGLVWHKETGQPSSFFLPDS